MFRPNVKQFPTLIRIQHRVTADVNGADDISYIPEEDITFCSWKSKGGTESVQSGSLVVYDTAEVTMWYQPGITESDRVLLNDNQELAYEVISPPENIEMRSQFLMFKVRRVVNT